MFGILRPCRNRLDDELRAAWTAHLCGMCLALRDEHGHLARVVTNYDAVVISALVEAQTGTAGGRRDAGPCALRGMRSASVADGGGARLAAAVSLLLASAKLTDHVADGDLDGALRARATRRVARRYAAAGTRTGAALDLDAAALLDVAAQQAACETAPASVLDVTAPTEAATALAFRHTAVVAGRPQNADALAEAGRLFGRLAYLLDAVEDVHDGSWNPIREFDLSPAEVQRLCDDARLGIRLALRDASFVDDRLVHVLLVHETETAVRRAFATSGSPVPPPLTPPLPPEQQPGQQPGAPGDRPPGTPGWEAPPNWEAPPTPTRSRNPFTACLGWLVVCGTCQVCCANEWTDPCTGRPHEGLCRGESCCDCCTGCDGCGDGNSCDGCGSCCDCCDCGGCDCSC